MVKFCCSVSPCVAVCCRGKASFCTAWRKAAHPPRADLEMHWMRFWMNMSLKCSECESEIAFSAISVHFKKCTKCESELNMSLKCTKSESEMHWMWVSLLPPVCYLNYRGHHPTLISLYAVHISDGGVVRNLRKLLMHEQARGADLDGGDHGRGRWGGASLCQGEAFVKERYRPQRYVREHMFVGRCRYQRSACA